MKKKEYIVPICSAIQIDYPLLKYTGPASVPAQTGAPERDKAF